MSLTPPLDNNCAPFLTPPLEGEPLVTSCAPSSVKSCEDIVCLWDNCYRTFDDPELLYVHLANDHVGRKSTGNLCLVCRWAGCGNSSKKRDHITSHLRVHVSSKPHTCEQCKKAFKRPQDLKKHEKTHTPQHQKKIFDSKITRIKNQPLTPPQLLPDDSPGTSSAPSPQLPCSPSSAASDSPVYPMYPIPHQCVPQFSDSVESNIFGSDYVKLKNSQKRSMEFLEELYQDAKKQRTGPKYNDALIEKLEGISDALEDNIDQLSLPPSLRKKEDLNILEEFFTQALQEIETNSNTYSTTALPYVPNIGYPLNLEGNVIDNGDSYNSVVGNVYPRTYNDVYVNSIPSPPEEYINSIPIQPLYIINPNVRQPQPVTAYINPDSPSFMSQIHPAELLQAANKSSETKNDSVKTEPVDGSVTTSSQVSNEPSTSGNSIDSLETSHKVSKIDEVQNGDDIVDKLSAEVATLSINALPNPKGDLYNDALKKKHIALINAIRKEVANLSRQLDETLVKPDDKEVAVQSNGSNGLSNSPKNSLSTQPISEGDKLNLEVESLVAIE